MWFKKLKRRHKKETIASDYKRLYPILASTYDGTLKLNCEYFGSKGYVYTIGEMHTLKFPGTNEEVDVCYISVEMTEKEMDQAKEDIGLFDI